MSLWKRPFPKSPIFQANGPSEENMTKARSIALSEGEEALKQNGHWLQVLKNAEIYPQFEVEDALREARYRSRRCTG